MKTGIYIPLALFVAILTGCPDSSDGVKPTLIVTPNKRILARLDLENLALEEAPEPVNLEQIAAETINDKIVQGTLERPEHLKYGDFIIAEGPNGIPDPFGSCSLAYTSKSSTTVKYLIACSDLENVIFVSYTSAGPQILEWSKDGKKDPRINLELDEPSNANMKPVYRLTVDSPIGKGSNSFRIYLTADGGWQNDFMLISLYNLGTYQQARDYFAAELASTNASGFYSPKKLSMYETRIGEALKKMFSEGEYRQNNRNIFKPFPYFLSIPMIDDGNEM